MDADSPPALSKNQRRWRLALWAVITALLVFASCRARFTSDFTGMLPTDEPVLGRELAFFGTKGATRMMAVEAWADDAARADEARAALHELPPKIASLGATPLATGDVAATAAAIFSHLPRLVSSAQLDAIIPELSAAKLRERLDGLRQRVIDHPEDPFAATAARQDLLAFAGVVADRLRGHMPTVGQEGDVLLHRDGQHALLPLEVAFPPDNIGRTTKLMSALDAASAAARAKGLHLEAVGGYRHFRDNYDGIYHDLITTMPPSLIAVVFLLWTLLRRWRHVAALHVPAMLSFLGAIAAIALTGSPLPLIILSFSSAFLGISVENAIHMTHALQGGEEASVRRPLLMSYLTTAVAFAVLIGSRIPALRCLGWLVVAGLLTALAASMTLLPALVGRRPGGDRWAPLSHQVLRLAHGRLLPRLLIAAAITAALVPGLMRLHFERDLKKMDGSRPETWAALKGFESRWGGLEASDFIVAQAPTLDAALDDAAVRRHALGLEDSPIEALLPSRAEQDRRLAAWNRFWNAHGDAFAANLAAACGSPRIAAAFSESAARYRPVGDVMPVTPHSWDGTLVEPLIDGLVQQQKDHWEVATPLALAANQVDELARRDRDAGKSDGAWLASRRQLAADLVEVIRRDLSSLGAWMGLSMLVLVIAFERRFRRVVATLLPPTLALVWGFGLLGWLNVPLTPFSVIVAAFVGGIGLDNAIFLADDRISEHALTPVLAASATSMIGVGSLLGAMNPLLDNAGMSVVCGMSACLVASVLLTPALAGAGERPAT